MPLRNNDYSDATPSINTCENSLKLLVNMYKLCIIKATIQLQTQIRESQKRCMCIKTHIKISLVYKTQGAATKQQ